MTEALSPSSFWHRFLTMCGTTPSNSCRGGYHRFNIGEHYHYNMKLITMTYLNVLRCSFFYRIWKIGSSLDCRSLHYDASVVLAEVTVIVDKLFIWNLARTLLANKRWNQKRHTNIFAIIAIINTWSAGHCAIVLVLHPSGILNNTTLQMCNWQSWSLELKNVYTTRP